MRAETTRCPQYPKEDGRARGLVGGNVENEVGEDDRPARLMEKYYLIEDRRTLKQMLFDLPAPSIGRLVTENLIEAKLLSLFLEAGRRIEPGLGVS